MAENYGSLEGTLDAHDTLEGEMNNHSDLTGEIQFGGGTNGVKDVKVNNESVVDENKVANIDLTPYAEIENVYDKQTIDTALEGKADTDDIPTALSQLDNDDNYVQDADYVHTDNNFTDEDKAAIGGIPENITDLSDVEVSNIQNGQVLKWDATQNKFVNANESGGGSGDVADVKVNGTSVVDPVTKEANIDLTDYAKTEDIPTDLADLSDDATHRLVTDTEKSTWDNKADVSDIPTVNNPTITIQKNGQNVDTFTLNQTTNKVIDISVPTKTSDLQNDSSFITNTVNNLANYYLKSDTYTQTEVNNLISAAVNGRFEKVTTLPASGEPNVIYLVPKTTALTNNVYDEYIWQDNAWELLGSTEIDLSNYVTTTDLSTALADYVTSSTFNTTIANYYTKTEIGNLLDGKVDKVSGKGLSTNDYDNTAKGIVDGVTNALAGKVDKVNGKGLSTEDYTTTEKNKLAGISTNANKVEASTTNGNIKIDSVETPIYRNYGNNTVLTTDKIPFLIRQTLNPTGFSGYVREKLIGGSYAWNNLAESITPTSDGLTITPLTGGGFRVQGSRTSNTSLPFCNNFNTYNGHKYFVGYLVDGESGKCILWYRINNSGRTIEATNGIIACTSDQTNSAIGLYITANQTIDVKFYPVCCDLTLAFGSTIADYLNNLSNNGGITKLRDMGCPIDKYTAYGNYLVSSKTSGKKIVGKNLVDSSVFSQGVLNNGSITESANWITTDFIPTFGEANITIYSYQDGTKQARCVRFSEYDASFNFIKDTANIWNKAGNFISVRTLDEKTRYIRSSHGFENIACTPAEYFATNRLMLIYGNSTIESYESYSSTTYSLGNDELRGLFKLVNNEIVADGDVKESNGSITRKYLEPINLGSLTWVYRTTGSFFDANLPTTMKGNGVIRSAKYVNITPSSTNTDDKIIGTVSTGATIRVRDSAYGTDASAFTTAMDGVYAICEIATPTTEQSTPFADPMSLVGATTEEYIDDRTISCPVGAERQYMGQSEDVVEIPSSPQSDGKRKLIAETSGGKTQYYFEDNGYPKTPIDVTAAEGFTVNYNASYRIGDVVYLTLLISTTTAVSSRTTCCTISDFACPKGTVRFVCAAAETHNSYLSKISTGFIQNNGTVRVGDNNPNAKDFAITICYVI